MMHENVLLLGTTSMGFTESNKIKSHVFWEKYSINSICKYWLYNELFQKGIFKE